MKLKLSAIALMVLNLTPALCQTMPGQAVSDARIQQQIVRSNDAVFLSAARLNYTNNLAEATQVFNDGKLSRRAMDLLNKRALNAQSQDFYGRLVDQSGKSVAGATVTAFIDVIRDLDDGAQRQYPMTTTDAEGRFQFTGVNGISIAISGSKKGYLTLPNHAFFVLPREKKTSAADRATAMIWKARDQMLMLNNYHINATLRADGTPFQYKMVVPDYLGSGSAPIDDGTIKVSYVRNPMQLKSNTTNFDWSVKIEVTGGSLVPTSDPYPFWATNSGYAPDFNLSYKIGDKDWAGRIIQDFYIKTPKGLYGFMHVWVHGWETPPAISGSILVDPNGTPDLQDEPAL